MINSFQEEYIFSPLSKMGAEIKSQFFLQTKQHRGELFYDAK